MTRDAIKQNLETARIWRNELREELKVTGSTDDEGRLIPLLRAAKRDAALATLEVLLKERLSALEPRETTKEETYPWGPQF